MFRRKKTGKLWQNHGQQNDYGKNGNALSFYLQEFYLTTDYTD